MADKNEPYSSDEAEKKIPVFTVLKNNSILKNIFVLDKPPLVSEPKSIESPQNENQSVQEIEETLVVGRHPDCNITLEHPSISRFHLRILSKPSSLKLFVTDLSSVHGTWVSGKKIEPEVRVELKEGDTMRLGASSRVYRLHWVPLSRAYDLDNPFVSPLDTLVPAEEIEETSQEENCLFAENDQIQLLGNDFVLNSLFSDENSESSLMKAIPSAPPLPEEVNSSFFSDLWSDQLASESVIDTVNEHFEEEDYLNPQDVVVPEVPSECKKLESPTRSSERKSNLGENLKLLFSDEDLDDWSEKENHEQRDTATLSYQPLTATNACLTSGIDISRTGDQQFNKEHGTSQSSQETGLSGIENAQCSLVRSEQKADLSVGFDSPLSDLQKGYPLAEILGPVDKQSPLLECIEQSEIPRLGSGARAPDCMNSSLPGGDVLLESGRKEILQVPFAVEMSQSDDPESPPIRSEKKSSVPSIWSRRGKPASVLHLQTSRSKGVDTDAKAEPPNHENIENELISGAVFSDLNGDEEEAFTPITELIVSRGVDTDAKFASLNYGNFENKLISEALSSDLGGDDEETFTPDKKNFTPNLLKLMQKMGETDEIKHSKIQPEALFSDLGGEDEEAFTPDKENFSPNTYLLKSMKKMGKAEEIKHSNIQPEALFSDLGGDDEETFTPDKENITPNTRLLKSMKKKGKAEEIKHSNIQPEEETLAFSEKGFQTRKVLGERKSVRPALRHQAKLEPQMVVMNSSTERLPFQTLLVNSTGKSKSEASVLSATTRSSKSMHYAETEEKNNSTRAERRKWNIMVDTTCLLNKESRKALQLLQGLKGTRLIIPRSVIRELDCLKRQSSLFRRTTEISSVLEWIEECMVTTKGWIHVQSSVEEGMPVAPTPPASPMFRFSAGSGVFPDGTPSAVPFSAYGSLLGIVTPTAEDHILEYALLFRRIKNDGQLVLLSDDVTLKIKAMAEGLLCETAEEFRKSLVNPFSDRFLWADSSPRGPTWSCVDDVILREKYSRWPSKKALKPGDGAKGLKLILLYRKISSIR